MIIVIHFRKYLEENNADIYANYFSNLTLSPPLFYSWKYGIRFEISMPWVEHEDKSNLQQIKERSTGIFNQVFQDEDEILLITDIHCEKNNTFLQRDLQTSIRNI